jgi:hypothetical protein
MKIGMETLDFKIKIKASPEKVWAVLWGDDTYRKWTAAFCEGSYVETNWNEGDKIYFLSPNGAGMNSIIDKKVLNEYMAFKHMGELKDFKEMPIDEATKEWSGAMETYRLTQEGDVVVLEAKVDVIEKYVDYFKEAFPKGIQKIKELSEERK